MSANPSHPGLTWNAAGSIGCFISGEPPVASPDANHVGLALIRLSQELGLDALEKLNGWFSGLLVEQRAPLHRGNRQIDFSRIAPSRPPRLTGRALAIKNHRSLITDL